MVTPADGRNTIDLPGRGRLERIDGSTAGESAATIIERAARRLLTADGGLAAGDVDGAFVAAYDTYRMAAAALLIQQRLRSTGGGGSRVTVEDAVSAQFASAIPDLARPTFERLRRMRHAAQNFDPSSGEINHDDASWALTTARTTVEAVERLLGADPPDLFPSPRVREPSVVQRRCRETCRCRS